MPPSQLYLCQSPLIFVSKMFSFPATLVCVAVCVGYVFAAPVTITTKKPTTTKRTTTPTTTSTTTTTTKSIKPVPPKIPNGYMCDTSEGYIPEVENEACQGGWCGAIGGVSSCCSVPTGTNKECKLDEDCCGPEEICHPDDFVCVDGSDADDNEDDNEDEDSEE